MMEFFIKCNPPKTTAQATTRVFKNKYTGKMFIGKSEKGRGVREELMALLRPYTPEKPIDKPIRMVVEWGYPYLKSVRKRDIGKILPCTSRPDCDNLAKFFLDCLTRLGFWTDDSLVYDLRFRKFYTQDAGIGVKIEENEEN
ncbi:MAG: RusA family crossover junction endodeoxyribonuclease [Bacteroidales bacterium]|nr:RusA family crossover junction endodeoxyribonuclease [Candidatus Scybalousia scybalohippi]